MGDVRPLFREHTTATSGLCASDGGHVVVHLTPALRRDLDAICAERESGTAADYLLSLLRLDLEARYDSGWTAKEGWPEQYRRGAP